MGGRRSGERNNVDVTFLPKILCIIPADIIETRSVFRLDRTPPIKPQILYTYIPTNI